MAWNLVCCRHVNDFSLLTVQIFRTLVVHCIPTLITVFIFFQPLKMNWPISLMLVCLMRETGKKKKGVQVNLSSHLRFQLKHATPFRWKALWSQVISVYWLRWYHFGSWNNYLWILCQGCILKNGLKTVHLYFFFYSLASICSFGSQKNQWVCTVIFFKHKEDIFCVR